MKIPAAELKEICAKLSASGAEQVHISPERLISMPDPGSPASVTVALNRVLVAEGSFVVSLGSLSAAAGKFELPVDISVVAGKLVLKSGGSRQSFPIIEKLAPVLPMTYAVGETIDAKLFKQMCSFAGKFGDGKIENLPAAASVYFKSDGTSLRALGFDSRRVAVLAADLEIPAMEFSIPISALGAFKVFGNSEEFMLADQINRIVAHHGGTILVIQKLAAKPPEFESVLNMPEEYSVEVNAKEVHKALSGVSHIVASTNVLEFGRVRLNFGPESGFISATGVAGEASELINFQQLIPDASLDDPETKVFSVSHKPLVDFFGSVEGPVKISSPGLRKSLTFTAGSYKMVLAVA